MLILVSRSDQWALGENGLTFQCFHLTRLHIYRRNPKQMAPGCQAAARPLTPALAPGECTLLSCLLAPDGPPALLTRGLNTRRPQREGSGPKMPSFQGRAWDRLLGTVIQLPFCQDRTR